MIGYNEIKNHIKNNTEAQFFYDLKSGTNHYENSKI